MLLSIKHERMIVRQGAYLGRAAKLAKNSNALAISEGGRAREKNRRWPMNIRKVDQRPQPGSIVRDKDAPCNRKSFGLALKISG